MDWVRWGGPIVGVASWPSASWQAASIGRRIVSSAVGVTAACFTCGALLVRVVRPLEHGPVPAAPCRAQRGRPGNQTRVILLAVGLGAFFILGVRSVQATLLDQFSVDLRPDAPDMFLIDMQRDQAADVERVIEATPGATACA